MISLFGGGGGAGGHARTGHGEGTRAWCSLCEATAHLRYGRVRPHLY